MSPEQNAAKRQEVESIRRYAAHVRLTKVTWVSAENALEAIDALLDEIDTLRAELATRLSNQEVMNRRAER